MLLISPLFTQTLSSPARPCPAPWKILSCEYPIFANSRCRLSLCSLGPFAALCFSQMLMKRSLTLGCIHRRVEWPRGHFPSPSFVHPMSLVQSISLGYQPGQISHMSFLAIFFLPFLPERNADHGHLQADPKPTLLLRNHPGGYCAPPCFTLWTHVSQPKTWALYLASLGRDVMPFPWNLLTWGVQTHLCLLWSQFDCSSLIWGKKLA